MDCFLVDQEAIARSVSHVPPAHYIVKIESYSLLAKNEVDKYQSEEFESCGYKWKLVIYPTGNERENVKDHISFYLAIANTTSVGFGWEIYAIFRLFLLDQKKDRFLIVQGRERRFHGLKIKWGFDQFIPLDEFNDASNGYLVDDTCVFGAEVFVKEKGKGKGECLSMIQTTSCFTCVWKIEKFSEVGEKVLHSEVFSAGGRKWKIVLYPEGSLDGTSTCLSMYLKLEDSTTLTLSSKIFANFTLRILDQTHFKHRVFTTEHWFEASYVDWGWSRFIPLSDLKDPSNGFLVNDVCVVEADVTVLGISKAL